MHSIFTKTRCPDRVSSAIICHLISIIFIFSCSLGQARSAPITRTFDVFASDFIDIFNRTNDAPVDPVRGRFTVTFDPNGGTIVGSTRVIKNKLNIKVDEKLLFDYYKESDLIIIGGGEAGTIFNYTNDFSLRINGASNFSQDFNGVFYYCVSSGCDQGLFLSSTSGRSDLKIQLIPSVTDVSKSVQLVKLYGEVLNASAQAALVWKLGSVACTLGPAVGCPLLAVGTAAVLAPSAWAIGQIINDPPDPDYTAVYLPEKFGFPQVGDESKMTPEAIDFANNVIVAREDLFSLLKAWKITLERYNAALTDDEIDFAEIQLEALDTYVDGATQSAHALQLLLRRFADWMRQKNFGYAPTIEEIDAALLSLKVDGFGISDTNFLLGLGLSNEYIEEMLKQIALLDPTEFPNDVWSLLENEAEIFAEFASLRDAILVDEPPILILLIAALLSLGSLRLFRAGGM